MSRHLLLEGLYHTAINEEELRRADMANIGLTEEAFFDLCIGVAHLVKEYYKDPAHMEALFHAIPGKQMTVWQDSYRTS